MSEQIPNEPPGRPPAGPGGKRAAGLQDFAQHAGLGLQLALSIGLMAWFGWWLDSRLGTAPIGLVLGVFTGFGAGLFSILNKVSGTSKTQPPPRARRTDERPPE